MNSDYLENLLSSHGVKPTAQRVVILDYLLSNETHPTAEEVHLQVASLLPVSISRATVYNTLNLFVEKGVIKALGAEPGSTRYDARMNSHHHFIDLETGKIFDLEPHCLSKLKHDLGENFKVLDYQITFYGNLKKD